jgi:hypothetical protein
MPYIESKEDGAYMPHPLLISLDSFSLVFNMPSLIYVKLPRCAWANTQS